MTAQRARNREAFDERVKEKEKEREMILKRVSIFIIILLSHQNKLKIYFPE